MINRDSWSARMPSQTPCSPQPRTFTISSVENVCIPDTVLDISSIAFRQDYEDRVDETTGRSVRTYYYRFIIHCSHGSIAEQYAIRREIPYVNKGR